MKLSSIAIALLVVASSTLSAQDPTVPSDVILQRMRTAQAAGTRIEMPSLPALRLKGLVMTDCDHGTAIVDAAGQRFVIVLDRSQLIQDSETGLTTSPRMVLQLNGIDYHLQDFYARTIILHDGLRAISVQ
ncbi:MAG: hypothetical protein KF752_11610 [Pirellulaceae bacterium]|nr:hypothetical protein [Pirellulaceae bacterium]